ncbi:MAG: hypothetical protein NTZ65_02435 [Candidatus Berkelbacteria bacterium]|nr:hypothetical protein [Candidatus Berkelbacteria bacterium]
MKNNEPNKRHEKMKRCLNVISVILLGLLYLFCGYIILSLIGDKKPILNYYELIFVILALGIMFVVSMVLNFMSDNPSSVNINFFKLFGVKFDYKDRGQNIENSK